MKTQGIRISDSKDNVLDVSISDILEEIQNNRRLSWCILFMDGMPNPGEVDILSECEDKINKSENGLFVDFADLVLFSSRFFKIYEALVLGCEKEEFLHRYKNDQEMYQSCDIVIELIDCAYWEVFAKDQKLIENLKAKFKEIELLEPDFEK